MGHLYLKKTKQRISTFCLSQGFHYAKGKWTQAHLKWLKSLELGGSDRETLDEERSPAPNGSSPVFHRQKAYSVKNATIF